MTISAVNPNDEGFSLQWSSPQEALAFAALGGNPDIVMWRPGVASSGRQFATWAEVYAALQAAGAGLRFVLVDPSAGAALMTPGAYDLQNVSFVGRSTGASALVTLQDGCTLTNLPLELWNVNFTCQSTGICHTVPTTGRTLLLRGASAIIQTGTGAFCSVPAPVQLTLNVISGSMFSNGAGAGPVFALPDAGSVVVFQLSGNSTVGGSGVGNDRTVQGVGVVVVSKLGSFVGFTPQNAALFTGTFQETSSVAKHAFFAGTCAAASLAAGCYLPMGDPSAPATPAAPQNWPIADQRRLVRLAVRIQGNSYTAATTVEFYFNTVLQGTMSVALGAGIPAGTVVLGPRVNLGVGAVNTVGVMDVRVVGGGGVGVLTLSVTLEYT